MTALQWVGRPGYVDTMTAYGIITRVITFALPLQCNRSLRGVRGAAELQNHTKTIFGMGQYEAGWGSSNPRHQVSGR